MRGGQADQKTLVPEIGASPKIDLGLVGRGVVTAAGNNVANDEDYGNESRPVN